MCVGGGVVSVIVKRPVLPPSVVDGRSRNPLYYYYEKLGVILTWIRVPGAARDFFSPSQHPVQTTL